MAIYQKQRKKKDLESDLKSNTMEATKNELYLKTAFACMACDGDIATEEIALVKTMTEQSDLFSSIDVENKLNDYVEQINKQGKGFLLGYLSDVTNAALSENEEMEIVKIAIQTIEADNKIEYSEISFFKKIRQRLNVSDETILLEFPDKEDYLLPDIKMPEDMSWNVHFENISLNVGN